MTGLTDPIRIETATFPVHQVSHKIPLMLEFSQMVRVIRLAPLPFSFPSRSLGLLDATGEPRDLPDPNILYSSFYFILGPSQYCSYAERPNHEYCIGFEL